MSDIYIQTVYTYKLSRRVKTFPFRFSVSHFAVCSVDNSAASPYPRVLLKLKANKLYAYN